MSWTGAAIGFSSMLEEQNFNKKCESLPKDEADRLRKERIDHRKALEVARAGRSITTVNNYQYGG